MNQQVLAKVRKAYAKGRYRECLAIVLPLAEGGNLDAQFWLGRIYLARSEEDLFDMDKGLSYLKKSTLGKNPAYLLEYGFQVWAHEREDRKIDAEDALTTAADLGKSEAQYFLATLLARGDWMDPNPEKAAQLYAAAAEGGSHDAAYNLGVMYLEGSGVEKDYEKGKALIESAANGGEFFAISFLSEIYVSGTLGFPIDKKEAARWKKRLET